MKKLSEPLELRLRERIVDYVIGETIATFRRKNQHEQDLMLIALMKSNNNTPVDQMTDEELLDNAAAALIEAEYRWISRPKTWPGIGYGIADYDKFRDHLMVKLCTEALDDGPQAAA